MTTTTLNVHPSAMTNNIKATVDVLTELTNFEDIELLELDMYYVSRLDSRAIRWLVLLHEKLKAKGARLVLVNVPHPILMLFENLRLADYLNISPAGRSSTGSSASFEELRNSLGSSM
mgnify:FL=1